jgi:hypothetical protein
MSRVSVERPDYPSRNSFNAKKPLDDNVLFGTRTQRWETWATAERLATRDDFDWFD